MALREWTALKNKTFKNDVHVITWSGILNTDTCNALAQPGSSDRSVQVQGVFGGGTITLEGSNDGVNYHVLTDPQGNALSFAAAKIEAVTELVAYVKPVLTGGGGTTNLEVSLCMRGVFS